MAKKCKYNHSYPDSSPCGGGVCTECGYKYPFKHDITKCGHNFPPASLSPNQVSWEERQDKIVEHLFELVDQYYPKIEPFKGNEGRGEALAIVATAVARYDKLIRSLLKEERERVITEISAELDSFLWNNAAYVETPYHTWQDAFVDALKKFRQWSKHLRKVKPITDYKILNKMIPKKMPKFSKLSKGRKVNTK